MGKIIDKVQKFNFVLMILVCMQAIYYFMIIRVFYPLFAYQFLQSVTAIHFKSVPTDQSLNPELQQDLFGEDVSGLSINQTPDVLYSRL